MKSLSCSLGRTCTTFVACALVLLVASGASADEPESTATQAAASTSSDVWATFWKHLQIRQNTNVKKDIAKPAFVTLTIPDEGDRTYQIGFGALASVLSTSRVDLDALVDYQRNSAAASLQDVFKGGATGEWRLWSTSASGHHQTAILTYRGNYKNDNVKDSETWQGAIGYTHLFIGAAQQRPLPGEGLRPFIFPNLPRPFGSALEVTYFPLLEFEFDRVFKAKTPEDEGQVTRALGQLSVQLLPAPRRFNELKQQLEFLMSYAYRHDLRDTTNETDDRHPLFTFDANYYPVKGDRGDFGFGISYLNGEDPDEGFERQAYWQFSLKMRLK